MLDQAKVLADTFDTAAPVVKAAPAVPVAAPVPASQQNVQVEQKLNEGLAAENEITTDELEKQAQSLV